eukprot:scaffold7057_cov39-Phaeocystis_antarctica.AAC.1
MTLSEAELLAPNPNPNPDPNRHPNPNPNPNTNPKPTPHYPLGRAPRPPSRRRQGRPAAPATRLAGRGRRAARLRASPRRRRQ